MSFLPIIFIIVTFFFYFFIMLHFFLKINQVIYYQYSLHILLNQILCNLFIYIITCPWIIHKYIILLIDVYFPVQWIFSRGFFLVFFQSSSIFFFFF